MKPIPPKRFVHILGHNIIESKTFEQAKKQRHHIRSNVAKHSLRVATVCAFLADICKKFDIEVNKPELVYAALCHDLGMIGRSQEDILLRREFRKTHPERSVDMASKLIGPLSEIEKEAILKHMWPLCSSKSIRYKETIIISLADKLCAITDWI